MRVTALPLVTIGITCFNAKRTITRAILSALSQNWPNCEILIVDDYSKDDSVAVIKRVIAGNKKVRIIVHDHNKGPASARNTLLKEAKGEFLIFFDDDDESFPNRVTKQVETLTHYEKKLGHNLLACYASGIRYYPNGYKKELPAIGSKGKEVPNGKTVADYLLFYQKHPGWFYGAGVPACALMARTSLFKKVNGFDENLRRVEDVDFAIRLAFIGTYFVGTLEPLFIQYATEAADKSPEKNLEAEQRIVKKHREYLRSIRCYYYALHWPKLRYWHFKRHYWLFILELVGLFLKNPLRVLMHLSSTGPRRLWHELKIRRSLSR